MKPKIRYLRNRVDGFIYEWSAQLAAHPKCEEVTEEEAYPERFIKAVMAGRPEPVVKLGLVQTTDTDRQASAEEYKPGAPSDEDIALQLARRFK